MTEAEGDGVTMEAKVGVICFVDGRRGHKPRNVGLFRSWKRQEHRSFPRAFSVEFSSVTQSCPMEKENKT